MKSMGRKEQGGSSLQEWEPGGQEVKLKGSEVKRSMAWGMKLPECGEEEFGQGSKVQT